MVYTLHAAPGACSLAPHIILEEIGDPYNLALMSPGHPETTTGEFHSLNPKGRIPVLVRDNYILTEAPAILFHLALERPDSRLLDRSGENIARTVEWCNWLSGTVHAVAVRMIWKPAYFSNAADDHGRIIEKGKQHLAVAFSFIEAKLSNDSWAVGGMYSIADAYLLVFYRWGNRMNIDMKASYPCWTLHAQRLEGRPAVANSLRQEGISIWS